MKLSVHTEIQVNRLTGQTFRIVAKLYK